MSGSDSSARAAVDAATQPVALTVHALPVPALAEAGGAGSSAAAGPLDAASAERRRRAGRLRMLLVLAVCAAPVVASYLALYLLRPEKTANYGALIHPGRPMPALALAALDGAPRDAATLHGRWLLVKVGPAACDSRCEQQLFFQRQLREMMGRERDRVSKVWLVSDGAPAAPALQRALQATPATTVLRADGAALAAWLEPEPGRTLADHLYIVDPLGHWMMRLPVDPDPSRAKRDLERLLRASASWHRPPPPATP